MLHPDPELDKELDGMIAKIATAQEPDGYLYTARTIDPKNPPRMSGKERWTNLKDSHELYIAGPYLRGGRRPLPGDGEKEPSSTSPSRAPTSSTRPSARAKTSSSSSPATRRSRSAWSSSSALTGKMKYLEPGQVLHRRAGQRRRPQALRRIRPGPQAGRRADRGRGPCRPGGLPVFGHDGCRGPDRRPALYGRHRQDLGRRRLEEALSHGRHRRRGRDRGLRPGL